MAPISPNSRPGFTLVELLVVIVIISMLIALLIPAVTGARARARQTECSNNQRNLAQAVLQYEMAKKRFPGYANRDGSAIPSDGIPTTAFPWPVVILKQLGRNDLADEWRSITSTRPAVRVGLFVCPSDEVQEAAPLSYVGNCGWIDESDPKLFNEAAPSGTGIFLDRSGRIPLPSLTMSDIRDGTQHTLMLAERRNPDEDPSGSSDRYRQWADTDYDSMKRDTGFIWQGDNSTTGMVTEMGFHISSNHPGGVNVSFCDGHQHLLSEEIEYSVYQRLMTPNGTGMVLVEGEDPVSQPPLEEGKY